MVAMPGQLECLACTGQEIIKISTVRVLLIKGYELWKQEYITDSKNISTDPEYKPLVGAIRWVEFSCPACKKKNQRNLSAINAILKSPYSI